MDNKEKSTGIYTRRALKFFQLYTLQVMLRVLCERDSSIFPVIAKNMS